MNVKIMFLSGSLEKLYIKKKFNGLFDIGVLSIHSANQINKDLNILFKDKAKVHVENADCLVMFKKEQKEQYKEKIMEKAKEASWKKVDNYAYSHHSLFEVTKQ